MEKSVTFAYVLETHRPDDAGRCRVKLRLIHGRKPQVVSLPKPVRCTPAEWDALQTHHIYKDTDARRSKAIARHKDMPAAYRYLYGDGSPLALAENIVRHMEQHGQGFSIGVFRQFMGNGIPAPKPDEAGFKDNLWEAFDHVIATERRHSRIGNAQNYECAGKSFLAHVVASGISGQASEMPFSCVTVGFLQDYQRSMMAAGYSLTTVNIYTRALRAVCNLAIHHGIARREQYPFGKRKFSIPHAANPKKSLSGADIQKLLAHRVEHEGFEQRSHDFWVLSYLLNGLNFKDILLLRQRDIDPADGTVTVYREKTTRTSSLKVTCYLNERSRQIIRRYRAEPGDPSEYVFPWMRGADAVRQDKILNYFIKLTNDCMKTIADELGIDRAVKVSTIAARHSFATTLMRAGVPGKFIQDSLGHTSFKTTENYLGSFEQSAARQHLEALLNPSLSETQTLSPHD